MKEYDRRSSVLKRKDNTALWAALGVGLFVGAWVLAAIMGWTTVINILIVLTSAGAAGGQEAGERASEAGKE